MPAPEAARPAPEHAAPAVADDRHRPMFPAQALLEVALYLRRQSFRAAGVYEEAGGHTAEPCAVQPRVQRLQVPIVPEKPWQHHNRTAVADASGRIEDGRGH